MFCFIRENNLNLELVIFKDDYVEDMEDASREESKSVGLEKEDAMNRARWRVGVGEMLEWGESGHPHLRG